MTKKTNFCQVIPTYKLDSNKGNPYMAYDYLYPILCQHSQTCTHISFESKISTDRLEDDGEF